jgi:hypothetical protein
MRASEFLQTLANVPHGPQREQAIIDAATSGSWVRWPMTLVTVEGGGREVGFVVADDYFAIGEGDDYLRMPMNPITAQTIGDRLGFMLPTPRMSDLIYLAAPNKLEPTTIGELGHGLQAGTKDQTALSTYAAHSAALDAALRQQKAPGLVAGHKKDVVISNRLNSGMVQLKECPTCAPRTVDSSKQVNIYGWQRHAAFPGEQNAVTPGVHIIQGNSIVHDNQYADYSHGIRMVSPLATVDKQPAQLTDVLTDPTLSKLLSHEGPLSVLRQPHVPAPAGSGWTASGFLPSSSNCGRSGAGCVSTTASSIASVNLDALFAGGGGGVAPVPGEPTQLSAGWAMAIVAGGALAGWYGAPALQRWWKTRARA